MGAVIMILVALLFACLWWNVGFQLGRWLRHKFGNWAGWVFVAVCFILLGVCCLNPYAAVNGLGLFVGSVCATFAKVLTDQGAQGGTVPQTAATKKCPMCAETIQYEATICRFCGHAFSNEEMARLQSEIEARTAAQQEDARQEREKQDQRTRLRKAGMCRFFAWTLAIISGFLLLVVIGCMFSTDPKTKMDPVVAIVPILLFVLLPGLGSWSLFKKARRLKNDAPTNPSRYARGPRVREG